MGSSVWALQQRQGVPQITKAFSSFQETTTTTHNSSRSFKDRKKKKKNLQQCWHAELNTVKNDLLLAGIKALQEGRISIRRVTITELLISSLGLLSGPFSHFINELSLGYLQGSPTHSWFIMCNMVNRRGMGAEGGGEEAGGRRGHAERLSTKTHPTVSSSPSSVCTLCGPDTWTQA